MTRGLLKLYVTGAAPNSQRAIRNLRRWCDEQLVGQYRLVVIDVMKQPKLAEDDKVLATPTLIRVSPLPARRLVGDLSDAEQVLSSLRLSREDGREKPDEE